MCTNQGLHVGMVSIQIFVGGVAVVEVPGVGRAPANPEQDVDELRIVKERVQELLQERRSLEEARAGKKRAKRERKAKAKELEDEKAAKRKASKRKRKQEKEEQVTEDRVRMEWRAFTLSKMHSENYNNFVKSLVEIVGEVQRNA